MDWFQNHGAKLLTALLTVLTAWQGYDPPELPLGTEGFHWLLFAVSVAALAHTTLVRPAPPSGLPPPASATKS